MTPTPNPPALLPVIQADRDAAGDILFPSTHDNIPNVKEWHDIVNGRDDGHRLVQAFARHRLQSTPAEAKAGEDGRCTLGVGCDETGVCYADAHDQPDQCGRPAEPKVSREAVELRVSTLFDALAHGDDIHREWLREAIDNHFAGLPVPPPRAALSNPPAEGDGWRAGVEAAAQAACACMVRQEWPPTDGDRQIDEVMAAIRSLAASPANLETGAGKAEDGDEGQRVYEPYPGAFDDILGPEDPSAPLGAAGQLGEQP